MPPQSKSRLIVWPQAKNQKSIYWFSFLKCQIWHNVAGIPTPILGVHSVQSHAHINPQSHDQRSQLRPCDVSGGDATMQPAKLVLHRSGFAWPIMFDLIYIDVICYKLYIYVCGEHMEDLRVQIDLWHLFKCRFKPTFALGLGMFYWSLRANMLFRALEPFWSQRSALVSEVHGFRSRFTNYPKLESYPRVSIARKTWKPGVSQETRLQIASNCHIYVMCIHEVTDLLGLSCRSW